MRRMAKTVSGIAEYVSQERGNQNDIQRIEGRKFR